MAAILGRNVSTKVLAGMVSDPTELHVELAALKRLELLLDQPDAGEPTLAFKHALTQEAAYESLIARDRNRLHELAGNLLEQLYAGHLELVEDRLAYHFARTDRADKAVTYLTRVGDRASRSHAMVEATTAFHAAREHAEKLADARERDRLHLDLIAREAMCRMESGDFVACVTLITAAEDLIERLADLSMRASCYWLLSVAHSQLGRPDETRTAAKIALEAANRCGDRVTVGRTLGGALTAANQIDELATRTGDPALDCYAGWIAAWVHALRDEGEVAVAAGKRAVRVAPTPAPNGDCPDVSGARLSNYLTRGDAQALPVLRQAVAALGEIRMPTLEAWCSAYLAEAHLAAGDTSAVRAVALQAETLGAGARVRLRARRRPPSARPRRPRAGMPPGLRPDERAAA